MDVKTNFNLTGKEAEIRLDRVFITCNKNTIPFDTEKPMITSGIRLGSAAMTTRGFKEEEFKKVASWIYKVIKDGDNPSIYEEVAAEVRALTEKFTSNI